VLVVDDMCKTSKQVTNYGLKSQGQSSVRLRNRPALRPPLFASTPELYGWLAGFTVLLQLSAFTAIITVLYFDMHV
jgi:hypothetical protein